MSETFGSVLDRHRGIAPGFDLARIALAVTVLSMHSFGISTGSYGILGGHPGWAFNYAVLPMFFGLSGFLVAGSAQRLSLLNFAVNRSLRILPALIVEIALSALILGPIFTTLSPGEYASSPQLFSYFANIVGYVHFTLPGVFTSNPYSHAVNGSIWTVPFEIICYFVMAFFIVTGIVKSGRMLLVSALAIVGLSMIAQFAATFGAEHSMLRQLLAFYIHGGKGPTLLPCFTLGAAFYTLRHQIPVSVGLFVASIALVAAFGFLGDPDLWKFTPVALLTTPAMIYMVCFVGMIDVPRLPYFSQGDYSYGVYLYHFPIAQSLMALYPDFGQVPALHLVATLMATTAFATLSWHWIERPVLMLRRSFSFVARREEQRHETAEEAPASQIKLADNAR